MTIGDFVVNKDNVVGVIVEQVGTCSRVGRGFRKAAQDGNAWLPTAFYECATADLSPVVTRIQVQIEMPLADKRPQGDPDPREQALNKPEEPALSAQDLFYASDPRVR